MPNNNNNNSDKSKIIYLGFLPGALFRNIDEVEILIETLHWINREKQKREILTKVDLIADEMEKVIQDLRKKKLISKADIAKLQLVKNQLTVFKNEALVELSKEVPVRGLTISRERQIELLRIKLLGSFNRFRDRLVAVLNELKDILENM